MKENKNSFCVEPTVILQALTENTNSYAYIYDYIQNSYVLSDGMARDFGLDQQGADFRKIWTPCVLKSDHAHICHSLQQAMMTQQTKLQLEYQAIDTHGHYRLLREQVTLRYHEQTGEPALLIGTLHDLTADGITDSDFLSAGTAECPDGISVNALGQDEHALQEQRTIDERMERFSARLKALLDATPLCLNLWNRNFENIMCNHEAVNLFGLQDEQQYIERFFELSPPSQPDGRPSQDKAAEMISKAFQSGKVQFSWMHCNLKGDMIPAEITLVRIEYLDDDGGPLVAGYTRDLRRQIAAEEESKQFNIRLKAILDATPLCLNLWNCNYENTMCNQEAVNLFGLENEQEYTEHFFELSPPFQPDGTASNDKALVKIKEAFKHGRSQFFWTHCNLKGEEIPAEITLVRIDDLGDGGQPVVAGFTRDIRTQLAVQQAQEQASQRIRAVLDSMPLACILWSLDMEILDCNQGAVSMFGAENKQDVMQNFDSFNPSLQPDGANSRQKKDEKFAEVVDLGFSIFEWVYCSKRGKEIPSEITLVKVVLSDEELIVAYSRDLRELYQTLELNDRLAKLAYHDPLTGCASRTRFMEKLEENFYSDTDCSLSLVILDVDNFKDFNDNYGHAVGDIVLKKMVMCAEMLIPKSCMLGRFGGDEFMIQSRHLNLKQLQNMLEQLVRGVSKLSFQKDGEEFSVSISAGASFKTAQDRTYQQLLERSDAALYEAKANGRNCSVIL